MAKYFIDGNSGIPFSIDHSGSTWIQKPAGYISTVDPLAIQETDAYHDNTMILQGLTIAGIAAVEIDGTNTDVSVNSNATLIGTNFGFVSAGVDVRLENFGRIRGILAGVYCNGENDAFSNKGIVQGDTGIAWKQGDNALFNAATGIVDASVLGISIFGVAGGHSRVVNDGLVRSGSYALEGSDGRDVIINHGRMVGSIELGDGKDLFDNRGGTVDHEIAGGTGSDTIIVDHAKTLLDETPGEGMDTVRSTVSYTIGANVERLFLIGKADTDGTGNAIANRLTGDSGDNHLFGKAGADLLDGKQGGDILTGGAGSDSFVFARGYGHDRVTDYQPEFDHIDLSRLKAIDGFNDLVHHHMSVDGGDLLITIGSDVLRLEGMGKAELQASDFIFG